MAIFKPGDKVVCIRPGDPTNGLKKDKIYTVFNTMQDASGADAIEVLEAMPPEPLHGYLAFRFRKAVDTDLPKVKVKIKEPQL